MKSTRGLLPRRARSPRQGGKTLLDGFGQILRRGDRIEHLADATDALQHPRLAQLLGQDLKPQSRLAQQAQGVGGAGGFNRQHEIGLQGEHALRRKLAHIAHIGSFLERLRRVQAGRIDPDQAMLLVELVYHLGDRAADGDDAPWRLRAGGRDDQVEEKGSGQRAKRSPT